MDKVLEAFKKFKTWYVLKEANGNELLLRKNEKEMFNLIESALNDYEKMKQTRIIVGCKKFNDDDIKKLKSQSMFIGCLEEGKVELLFDEKTQKKLKALEIIKSKKVDMDFLFEEWEEENWEFALENYNINHEIELTKREYRALKKYFYENKKSSH